MEGLSIKLKALRTFIKLIKNIYLVCDVVVSSHVPWWSGVITKHLGQVFGQASLFARYLSSLFAPKILLLHRGLDTRPSHWKTPGEDKVNNIKVESSTELQHKFEEGQTKGRNSELRAVKWRPDCERTIRTATIFPVNQQLWLIFQIPSAIIIVHRKPKLTGGKSTLEGRHWYQNMFLECGMCRLPIPRQGLELREKF